MGRKLKTEESEICGLKLKRHPTTLFPLYLPPSGGCEIRSVKFGSIIEMRGDDRCGARRD